MSKNLKDKLTMLETNEKLLKAKIKRLNKKIKELNGMFDDIPVLRGKAAKQFEEYNNRPRTEEEIADMKRAEEYYLLADHEETEKRKMRRLARAILTDKYDGETRWQLRDDRISTYDIDLVLDTFKDIVKKDVMKNLNKLNEVET